MRKVLDKSFNIELKYVKWYFRSILLNTVICLKFAKKYMTITDFILARRIS
jgi:hypothetical protein